MAFLQFEDREQNAEVIVFPRLYKQVSEWLSGEHTIFVIKGNLDIVHNNQCKIKAQELVPIELFFDHWKKSSG